MALHVFADKMVILVISFLNTADKLNTQGPMGAGARTTRCGGGSARRSALVPYLLATPPLPLSQPNYIDKFVFCCAKA
jgi:hypothetical protein